VGFDGCAESEKAGLVVHTDKTLTVMQTGTTRARLHLAGLTTYRAVLDVRDTVV